MKSQAALADQGVDIKKTVDARKEKIDADAAWKIIKKFNQVIIGKGKKYTEYDTSDENKPIILKNAMGRSGNLRAPALELGKKLIIGYNEDMYGEFVK